MALDKKLQKKLADAGKKWNKAKERATTETGGGADEFEDGRYIARLVSAEVNEAKSSGRLQITWGYKIAEGEAKGRIKYDYEGLETEDNLMYLARKINKYGYEAPDDLEGVNELLPELVKEKPLVRIRLKTRGDFQNAYVDNVFSKEDEDEVLKDAAAEGDEDEGADEEGAEEDAAEEEGAEEESGDDEAVELQVGMRVTAEFKGEKLPGEVIEILDKENKARVKTDAGKTIRVDIESLETMDEEEAEEEDADAEEETDEEEDVPPAPKTKPTAKKQVPKKKGKK